MRRVINRVCSIEGCDGAFIARGWCSLHYQRWQSHGDPLREPPGRKSLLDRLADKFTIGHPSGCWEWTGYVMANGYGTGKDEQNRNILGHRALYELLVGAIPQGLTIDHLCRVRHCVNPAHMELVTSGVNTLRGNAPSAVNARKTHCNRGHALTGANLQVGSNGHRRCKACAHLTYKIKAMAS